MPRHTADSYMVILDYLCKSTPTERLTGKSHNEIVAATGYAHVTVRKALRSMRRDGRVEKIKHPNDRYAYWRTRRPC